VILYVNGDSHSAGAEAVNEFCFAEDDSLYYALGRIPHPDNERVSYGCNIANKLNAVLHCDAESASSNSRIIRTTRDYLKTHRPDAIIIGWSTWEREEWFYNNVWWQVNAGGVGHDWPDLIKERYKEYILDLNWEEAEKNSHAQIRQFHIELQDLQIPHLFFNTYSFFSIPDKKSWGNNYLSPYDKKFTYWQWLTDNGFKSNINYHFGAEAHEKWADFLLPHLTSII
jgi:hypothetical protein